MSTTIYLITIHEESDAISGAPLFTPEAYTVEDTARKRYEQLQADCEEYCGYYYTLEPIELDPT
jgi:hypothetical protein